MAKPVTGGQAWLWTPKADGSFAAQELKVAAKLSVGDELRVPVPLSVPMAVLTLGGYVGGALQQAWAVLLPPSGLRASVAAPQQVEPLAEAPVTVTLTRPTQRSRFGGSVVVGIGGVGGGGEGDKAQKQQEQQQQQQQQQQQKVEIGRAHV